MATKVVSGEIDVSKVKGLLFDVDGTLSDTDDHMVARFSNLFKPLSFVFPNHDPRGFSRWLVMASETPANFLYSAADRLGLDAPIANIYNWLVQHRPDRFEKKGGFQLIPGVKEMLTALNGRFPMAVVSARDSHTTRRFLEFFNIRHYFEIVVTSQTCQHTKPFPDPVLFAAQELGLQTKNCLMIGDTIVDVRAGRAAGAQTAAVLCGFGTQRELQRAGADLVMTSTPDLVELFES